MLGLLPFSIEQLLQKSPARPISCDRLLHLSQVGLRRPGSAKPDARELYLVANKAPAVTNEAAKDQIVPNIKT